jgi:hypothetical protein
LTEYFITIPVKKPIFKHDSGSTTPSFLYVGTSSFGCTGNQNSQAHSIILELEHTIITDNCSMLSTSSTHEHVSADDAILATETSNSGQTVTLTMAPGWEHALPQTFEHDPGCLVMWDDENCVATVKAFNAAIANGEEPPAWLNVARDADGSITVSSLQKAILAHAQTSAGGGRVVGNAMIASNTVQQYVRVCTILFALGMHPFFRDHAVCPIGRNFILADSHQKTTAVVSPIEPPDAGVGVPVFA